jgi:hypothetical protein
VSWNASLVGVEIVDVTMKDRVDGRIFLSLSDLVLVHGSNRRESCGDGCPSGRALSRAADHNKTCPLVGESIGTLAVEVAVYRKLRPGQRAVVACVI